VVSYIVVAEVWSKLL